MSEKLRAAIVTAPGRVEIVEAPLPTPGPGEVRVRLDGCGVCASNLTPWAGPSWMRFPTEPGGLGHEGWGVIDAIGGGVTDLSEGDRVAALTHHSFASHDVGPASHMVRLPADWTGPFPGEALGCAMNIFRRTDIHPGQTVVIIGIGFLGALLTRLSAQAGATVIAISRRQFALDTAIAMGAAHTIALVDHNAILEQVRELTGGIFADRVIEAVGKQWPLDLASALTREMGRLVIAGYHQDGPRQVNMQLWNWRGLDVINAHERETSVYLRGIHDAVEAVASGRIDPAPLLTHRFPLADLAVALDATRDRPDGFMKAYVTP